MTDTSLLAYFNDVLPKLGEKQKIVLEEILKHKDITDKEITHNTGLELSCVNGRRNELVEKKLIVDVPQRRYSKIGRTKNKVIAWTYNKNYDLDSSHLKESVKLMIKNQRYQKSLI